MQYEISNRMSDVHGSAIRELFKLGADPNMISFGGGNPSAETFPVPEIADIIADVMKDAPVSVLQYGLSEGYTPLRDTMKDYLTRTQGFDFENNELFILSGGQQCADLTTKVLVNGCARGRSQGAPRDQAAVHDPILPEPVRHHDYARKA